MKKIANVNAVCILVGRKNYIIKTTFFYIVSFLLLASLPSTAQTRISGITLNNETQEVLANVAIHNVLTDEKVSSDNQGEFELTVNTGDLVDVQMEGFDRVRIRIGNEKQPLFYKLQLDKTIPRLDVRGHLLPYQRDSLEYAELYTMTLNGAKKGVNNACPGNFSLDALSKKTRERWAFQALYANWQNEKYIDYVFNKELVKKITYLEGEELDRYMKYYRPTYSFLRSSTEYEYLEYIKQSYRHFQQQQKY